MPVVVVKMSHLLWKYARSHSYAKMNLLSASTTFGAQFVAFTDCTGEAMDVDESAAPGAAATAQGMEHAQFSVHGATKSSGEQADVVPSAIYYLPVWLLVCTSG